MLIWLILLKRFCFNFFIFQMFLFQFIEQSEEYIGFEGNSRVQNKFVESLHTFKPSPNYYDLIWIQWVTGQLSDDDLTNFLRRCKVWLFYCSWEFWGKLWLSFHGSRTGMRLNTYSFSAYSCFFQKLGWLRRWCSG